LNFFSFKPLAMTAIACNYPPMPTRQGDTKMARQVPHEITLFAFTRNKDGTTSVDDVVATSFHFASRFVRRWLRDPKVCAIGTSLPAPGPQMFDRVTMHPIAA
jgi:hypothetical protein